MSTPEEFIAAARSFVDTKFHAGGRCPGVGLDCIGVAVCAAIKCGLRHSDIAAYPMRPNGTLIAELERQLVRVHAALPGDILAMQFDKEPHHIAVFAGETLIHAYTAVRKCVEQPMHQLWRDRTKRIYRFREFC